jgi:hypothetical protein
MSWQPSEPPPGPDEVVLHTRAWIGMRMREGVIELARDRVVFTYLDGRQAFDLPVHEVRATVRFKMRNGRMLFKIDGHTERISFVSRANVQRQGLLDQLREARNPTPGFREGRRAGRAWRAALGV